MRELAGELRDEGGQRAREKKKFEEERRKKRSRRERERKGKEYFNEKGERSVIKKKKLVLSYSAHLKIDVHCS